jgi:peptidoglycan/xylan/chitin deacetylase (PgdA/CDA1 family)
MRHASDLRLTPRPQAWLKFVLAWVGLAWCLCTAANAANAANPNQAANPTHPVSSVAPALCKKPVYLTFDTGHMGVAPLIAQVLRQHQVPVTFFAAYEKTKEGDGSLGVHWAPWWKERALEGHEFASHTYDHAYWRADLPDQQFKIRPSAGEQAGRDLQWTATDYCANLKKAADRLEGMTGKATLPLFRAPGGKTSPALIKAAQACGYTHVGWAPAGFLGDELPSQTYSNKMLLDKALKNIRSGDVLVAHLGIWSRQDPWAPAVLEPLIVGLKEKGFCFATLRQHPQYSKLLNKSP